MRTEKNKSDQAMPLWQLLLFWVAAAFFLFFVPTTIADTIALSRGHTTPNPTLVLVLTIVVAAGLVWWSLRYAKRTKRNKSGHDTEEF